MEASVGRGSVMDRSNRWRGRRTSIAHDSFRRRGSGQASPHRAARPTEARQRSGESARSPSTNVWSQINAGHRGRSHLPGAAQPDRSPLAVGGVPPRSRVLGCRKPRVLILRAAGTNCDGETAVAFRMAGADVMLYHVNDLIREPSRLEACPILALPGGFTYGDDIASGKILANELRCKLAEPLRRFMAEGKLIIGICNGFQVLVKAGFLPNTDGAAAIEATLTLNDSGRFEDRWVRLRLGQGTGDRGQKAGSETRATSDERRATRRATVCVWTRGMERDIELPVAHGEGKFVAKDDRVLKQMQAQGQIVFQYADAEGRVDGYPANPNGSVDGIAGICDPTGRILGLMPHPERHVVPTQHPRWTRGEALAEGDGLAVFRNGVEYAARL